MITKQTFTEINLKFLRCISKERIVLFFWIGLYANLIVITGAAFIMLDKFVIMLCMMQVHCI
jgi:hypothetical protein